MRYPPFKIVPFILIFAKSQAPACPIPSAWKGFLQERFSVFSSFPPRNWVLSPFLAHNGPSAPESYCAMYQKQSAINCTNLIFFSLHLFQDENVNSIKTEVHVCLSFESLPKNPASSFLPPPSQKRQAFSPAKNHPIILIVPERTNEIQNFGIFGLFCDKNIFLHHKKYFSSHIEKHFSN